MLPTCVTLHSRKYDRPDQFYFIIIKYLIIKIAQLTVKSVFILGKEWLDDVNVIGMLVLAVLPKMITINHMSVKRYLMIMKRNC